MNLSDTFAYKKLLSLFERQKDVSIKSLFEEDAGRFPSMTASAAGLMLDYSKNSLSDIALSLLLQLAEECGLPEKRQAMFAGEKINVSENRAVLHTALRSPRTETIIVDGINIMPKIRTVLERMRLLTEAIHSGRWTGFTDKRITDVVNIGIGGSDFGPRMVCAALRHYKVKDISTHFVSNVDAHELEVVLEKVDPETTLFIISSKSFTTKETLLNAQTARNWFLSSGVDVSAIQRHFVAVTANVAAAKSFGIREENIYPIWDWVGGRYSVWSAIGLPVMLSVGSDHFMEFLSGAHAMDMHFRYAPLEHNMPVLMALVGIWNRNFLDYHALAVAPYHEDLSVFSRWLQQLEMESNGKSIQVNGKTVSYGTAPVILGNTGTNGQHSYFQLFHQGTDICPIDFIAVLRPGHQFDKHHALVLANCFAQSEAMMSGKDSQKAREEMIAQGVPVEQADSLCRQKQFDGNRPSNTIVMNMLCPETLGALMALYEHKVFVQGVIWNINSFDQWGVELGKKLATRIHSELTEGTSFQHDSSTSGLIALAKAALE